MGAPYGSYLVQWSKGGSRVNATSSCLLVAPQAGLQPQPWVAAAVPANASAAGDAAAAAAAALTHEHAHTLARARPHKLIHAHAPTIT